MYNLIILDDMKKPKMPKINEKTLNKANKVLETAQTIAGIGITIIGALAKNKQGAK